MATVKKTKSAAGAGSKPRAACWLVKTEPYKYPFDQLVADGKTTWDGVRNFEARNNLRAMRRGDWVLVYHSNEGKEIVGVARVEREAYADPTAESGDWSVVDLVPVKKVGQPLGLDAVREDRLLSGMQMIRRNRLSVTSVSDEELARVLELTRTRL